MKRQLHLMTLEEHWYFKALMVWEAGWRQKPQPSHYRFDLPNGRAEIIQDYAADLAVAIRS